MEAPEGTAVLPATCAAPPPSSESLLTIRPAKKSTKWTEQNRTKLSTQVSLNINVRNSSALLRLLSPEARRWAGTGLGNHPLAPPGQSSRTASKWRPRLWGLVVSPGRRCGCVWLSRACQPLESTHGQSLALRPTTGAVPTSLKRRHQGRKRQGKAFDAIRGACDCRCMCWNLPGRHQRFQERHLPCRALGPTPAMLAVIQPPFYTHLPVLPLSLPAGPAYLLRWH